MVLLAVDKVVEWASLLTAQSGAQESALQHLHSSGTSFLGQAVHTCFSHLACMDGAGRAVPGIEQKNRFVIADEAHKSCSL